MSITKLNNIHPNEYVNRIRVRVARLWTTKKFDSQSFDGLHYLLIDEMGATMHAVVDEHNYDHTTKLEEGCIYDIYHVFNKTSVYGYKVVDRDLQLTFNQTTKFVPVQENVCSIPRHAFQFLQFEQVEERLQQQIAAAKEKDNKGRLLLIDVYGCIKDIDPERERYIASRDVHESICVITLENQRRKRLKVTLWADQARNFDTKPLQVSSKPIFAAFTSLRLKPYRDYITPTSTNHTCVIFNPQLPETAEYEAEFDKPGDTPQINASYRQLKKDERRKTIFDLWTLDPEAYRDQIVVCCATIIRFSARSGWWYKKCSEPNCDRQLRQQAQPEKYECPKHGFRTPLPSYRVYMTIEDENKDQITLTLMGKQAEDFFGYTCAELLDKGNYTGLDDLPDEITINRDHKYVFDLKVSLNREMFVKGVHTDSETDQTIEENIIPHEPISATPEKLYERKRLAEMASELPAAAGKTRAKRQEKEAGSSFTKKQQTEKNKRE